MRGGEGAWEVFRGEGKTHVWGWEDVVVVDDVCPARFVDDVKVLLDGFFEVFRDGFEIGNCGISRRSSCRQQESVCLDVGCDLTCCKRQAERERVRERERERGSESERDRKRVREREREEEGERERG
jgi:hypothetical protein